MTSLATVLRLIGFLCPKVQIAVRINRRTLCVNNIDTAAVQI